MKFASYVLVALLIASVARAQSVESPAGFRTVLKIMGIEPAALSKIDAADPSMSDWQTMAQIIARLGQNSTELGRWTTPSQEFVASRMGDLFELQGTVERFEEVAAPAEQEPRRLYHCQLKLDGGQQVEVLAERVPERWQRDISMAEPVSLRGVLLHVNEAPLFLTTRLRWFPRQGVPPGQLLLAQFGMDASLWDDIVQRSAFVSPETAREAHAFYASLAAIARVPTAKLAALTQTAIANSLAARPAPGTTRSKQIAAAIAEQAERGLSSVAPLFLESDQQVGQLVRLAGVARRAVRIVADKETARAAGATVHEFYELEVFTTDSQNLPIVCCVTRLPADFPLGDAIRARVQFDGIFFKLWRYQSRKGASEPPGETTTPRRSYTPVVMAATVTWLQQTPAPEHWWGLVVGVVVFVAVMAGLLRMVLSARFRRQPLSDEQPDFSRLDDQ